MAELTKSEKSWLKKLQKVMDDCPSERIGFYTIGDPEVSLYDRDKQDEIYKALDGGDDFAPACESLGANFNASIRFPSHVHSTAG